MRYLYLVFAIVGVILPYSEMIPFMIENDNDLWLLFEEQFQRRSNRFFAYDLLLTGTVASIFILYDGRRNQVKNYWFAFAGIFLVGVCFGLPLYLFFKESARAD
ncbi:MAG: DUF2834 domain-containing protein [Flavobacteriales bacterium]|nr:DUF2834 domain-containing protein [Flavobacteriales bacterium]